MFINVEEGKVKLYDLRIYKRFEKVKPKLMYDCPYEYITEEHTYYFFEQRINSKKDLRVLQSKREIGIVEHNDFYSNDETLYECRYQVFHLNELFLLLESIEKCDYSKLEALNQYIESESVGNKQELFEKYRNDILKSLKLVEILSFDIPNFMKVYNLILKKSKGDIKQILEKLKTYIYTMNLESVPKLILKK